MQNKIKAFENKQVRTLWNADEEGWYFFRRRKPNCSKCGWRKWEANGLTK